MERGKMEILNVRVVGRNYGGAMEKKRTFITTSIKRVDISEMRRVRCIGGFSLHTPNDFFSIPKCQFLLSL